MPGYTIPNSDEVTGISPAWPSRPQRSDFEILAHGFSEGAAGSTYGNGPTGVESGCAVTAQGSPDMTVAVASGVVRIGGRRVVVASGNVTITTANGSNPRWDHIVVNTSGTKSATAGTAAATPKRPDLTAGTVVLAAVYVPASDTTIGSTQIFDKRAFIPTPAGENVMWYGAAGSGSGDDSAAIQAAMDAADTIASTSGRAVVIFPPSTGKWRITSQITWKTRVSVRGFLTGPIIYAGTTLADGVIITENTGDQNQQFDQWTGVGVEGGTNGAVLADYGIRFIAGTGKTDFGTLVADSPMQYFNKSAIRYEGGATNLHIRGCRWDHCTEYAVDITRPATAGKTIDFVSIEEFTYDNQSATGVPDGFLRVDQGNQGANDAPAHIAIANGRVELNKLATTTTTSGLTLPQGTIAATDTSTFASAGNIWVTLTSGAKQEVAYTGKTGTTFTGCTGGVGAYSNGATVAQGISEGVINLIQPTTDPGGKISHHLDLRNVWVASPVNQGDAFPLVRIRQSDGTDGTAQYVIMTGQQVDPRTRYIVTEGQNVTKMDIGAQRNMPLVAWGDYSGSPTNSQTPIQFRSPLWLGEITAPGTPPTGVHSMYLDVADGILKSKNSAGTITVYGARTRSMFIDGSILRMDAATGVRMGTPPNAVDGVSLADGVTSGAYCNFIMPVDAFAGTVTVRPIWAPAATDATPHTVRWQMNIRIISAVDVTAAGTTVTWTGDSAARTVNVEVMETGQASTGVSPAANDRVRLEIQRVGGDGADTYVGAVNLIGARIDFSANN